MWLWLWFLVAATISPSPAATANPELMDTMGLMDMYQMQSEKHKVETEDGYMLTLHRALRRHGQQKGPPVLLQHGLMAASDMWIMRGPEKDLVFKLVDAGYDIWLGNVRGNTYCQAHRTLNKTMESFWDFSFHEMGYYDVPAMIDYILEETGHKQLFYFGHSMGTTVFYVTCSTRPEYNKKIRAMFSLAPVAYMSDFHPGLKRLAKYRFQIWDMLNKQNIHEIWPRIPQVLTAGANLCRDGSPVQPMCTALVFAITGADYKQFNKSMLPMIVTHSSSTNPRTLAHYAQNIESGRFQSFDWGYEKNLRLYGSKDAPDYNVSLITAPVTLHYSENDLLSSPKDVMKLAQKLPNVVGVFKVPYKKFNHIDYLWAKDAYSLLYKNIIQIMSKM